MSSQIEPLVTLVRDIASRPQMFALTPEVAHGLIQALAWAILQQSTGRTLGECMTDSLDLIRVATGGVGESQTTTPLLCHESYPNGSSTFDAFRVHATRFAECLVKRLDSAGEENQEG